MTKDPTTLKRITLVKKIADLLLGNIQSSNLIESIKIMDNIPNCNEYTYGVHAFMPDQGKCRIILKKSLFEKKNLKNLVNVLTHELAHSLMADLFTTVELSRSITKYNLHLLRERQACVAASLVTNAIEKAQEIKEILDEISNINKKLSEEISKLGEEEKKEINKEEELKELEPSTEEKLHPDFL